MDLFNTIMETFEEKKEGDKKEFKIYDYVPHIFLIIILIICIVLAIIYSQEIMETLGLNNKELPDTEYTVYTNIHD